MINALTYVLYLPRMPQQPYRCYQVDKQGFIVEQQAYDQLDAINLPESAPLVVLIPGEQVVVTSIHLPNVSRSEWAQVVPYELEDRLINDIEDYHFALGQRDDQHNIAVAVMDRTAFEDVMAQLQQQQLVPDIITADFLLFPQQSDHWYAWIEHGLVITRVANDAGFVVDYDNLDQQFQHQATSPASINIMAVGDRLPDTALPAGVTVNSLPLSFDDSTAINLLQGAYRPKQQRFKIPSRWRLSVYVVAAVIGALVVSNISQYLYLHHRSRQLQAKVVANYQRLFSDKPMTSGVAAQVDKALQFLSQLRVDNPLLSLLSKVGPLFKANANVELMSLRYVSADRSITVQLALTSVDQFNALVSQLSQTGLRVQQSQRKREANKLIVELTIAEIAS